MSKIVLLHPDDVSVSYADYWDIYNRAADTFFDDYIEPMLYIQHYGLGLILEDMRFYVKDVNNFWFTESPVPYPQLIEQAEQDRVFIITRDIETRNFIIALQNM